MEHTPKQDVRAIAIGALLILLVGAFFIGRILLQDEEAGSAETASGTQEAASQAASLSPDDLKGRLSRLEKLTLIDVRSPEAFAREHIPHSRLVPVAALESFTPADNNPVVIITSDEDKFGQEQARAIMREKPYTYFFLTGGFEAWQGKGFATISQGDPTSFKDQAKVTFVTKEEALELLKPENNTFILDVQPVNKFNEKHLKGAKNIPLAELEERFREIPPARQILVYGADELTSFQGGVRLFDLSFFVVRTLSGNQNLTPESGLPLEP